MHAIIYGVTNRTILISLHNFCKKNYLISTYTMLKSTIFLINGTNYIFIHKQLKKKRKFKITMFSFIFDELRRYRQFKVIK